MKFSICSFAFHRGFYAGEVDGLRYIELSRELGATHLHFWVPHLLPAPDLAVVRGWDWRPDDPRIPAWLQAPADLGWAATLREAIAASGLGVEMLALEKGYAWLADAAALAEHRAYLRRWLEFAAAVGIPAVRLDPGVGRDPSPEATAAVVTGYREVVALAADHGLRVFVENHWGASQQPAFLEHLLEAVPALGYLLDTWNFSSPAERAEGWARLHRRAGAVHVKTRAVQPDGTDASYPVADAVRLLHESGYDGVWGIESFCPPDHCDEAEAVRRTMSLIRRSNG